MAAFLEIIALKPRLNLFYLHSLVEKLRWIKAEPSSKRIVLTRYTLCHHQGERC